MEKEELTCTVVTPLFSFGFDTSKAELRPTELKALMRYTYNVVNGRNNQLEQYFGSTNFKSPIGIEMEEMKIRDKKFKQSVKLHKEDNKFKQSVKLHKEDNEFNCINTDDTLRIILRLRKPTSNNNKESEITLDFYKKLLKLGFYLFGMGKRARRARGRLRITKDKLLKVEDIRKEILGLLNFIGDNKYMCENDNIRPVLKP